MSTKRVGNFAANVRFVCDKHVFDEFIYVPFENKQYKAPIGYHEWLTAIYGDYMKLPPVNEQVNKHEFKAYYL